MQVLYLKKPLSFSPASHLGTGAILILGIYTKSGTNQPDLFRILCTYLKLVLPSTQMRDRCKSLTVILGTARALVKMP